MNEDFLRWVGEKKLGGWCLSVSVCVCVCSSTFRALRPNGWSDRDRGGTDGRAETPERAMVPVTGRPAARGTWHVPPREGLPKIFEHPYRSHEGAPQIRNSQVTRVLYQLKIRWGCRSCGVPAACARGEEAVLTWGPPVKVNFEPATPNPVHGCTSARPTWRRMKKGAGVHCARAVHVQVF